MATQSETLQSALAAGLSTGFASLPGRPLEFVLTGHFPNKEFSLLDACAISVLIGMMLNRGLTGDVVRHRLKTALGDKALVRREECLVR